MQHQKIENLDVIVKSKPGARVAVLVLHGYGADSKDLASIADFVGRDLSLDWYFPNGILEVPIGPGFTGRAWFPIDAAALERAAQRGEFRDFKGNRPDGIGKAKKAIAPLYKHLKQKYDRVIIGGFSQGAMISCDIAFSAKDRPDGLVIMSGAFVDEKNWSEWLKTCGDLEFIQSHGEDDPVLPHAVAKELYTCLKQHGLKGNFLSFRGGHEIPPNVMSQLQQFLQKQVNSLTK